MTYRIFRNAPFDPETLEAMSVAFERACCALALRVRNDPINDIVAKKIVNFAHQGMRDPDQLTEATLISFRSEEGAS